jgi:uncharacterized protein YccT (UPF0319 family)
MNHISANSHKIFFWIIMILFLSACQGTGPYQAYEGPAKASNEIATFIVPAQYNLLSIDGVKYTKTLLKDGAIVNTLPGSHQFILEYHDFWDLTGESHEKVTSKPISITFNTQAGTQYTINATQLETIEQAQAFAEKPDINIVDTTTKQTTPAKIKYNLYGRDLFTMLFGAPKPEPTTSGMENTHAPVKDNNILETLKIWWEKADENQQKDFRQWLKNH